jgi:D-serine deaminase-like pyridoxal phosphate-dependent protein
MVDHAHPGYARLERATADLQPPFALVDLDALWWNAADMTRRAAGKPIRLASKSVRCRELQERVLASEGFAGTMAFTLREALWLAAHGTDDLLVAYPTTDAEALAELASSDARITVMVDCMEQVELVECACGPAQDGRRIRLCMDVDAGLWLLGGRIRLGVKRSPIHTAEQAATLAREIVTRERVQLVGLMAYEGQIAGVGDAPPGRRLRAALVHSMQSRSARELAKRRGEIVAMVGEIAAQAGTQLEFVNGGGTGSLHLTEAEDAVTELTAGSGLYGPGLFDSYRAFTPRPAAMFALPVVRRPGAGVVTALGGGYLASGPGDGARLPHVHLPRGLRLNGQEGAGEVQTPLEGPAADGMAIGDRVYMRHAKAGELCERFNSLYLLEGDEIVGEAQTYRGEGQCFL